MCLLSHFTSTTVCPSPAHSADPFGAGAPGCTNGWVKCTFNLLWFLLPRHPTLPPEACVAFLAPAAMSCRRWSQEMIGNWQQELNPCERRLNKLQVEGYWSSIKLEFDQTQSFNKNISCALLGRRMRENVFLVYQSIRSIRLAEGTNRKSHVVIIRLQRVSIGLQPPY